VPHVLPLYSELPIPSFFFPLLFFLFFFQSSFLFHFLFLQTASSRALADWCLIQAPQVPPAHPTQRPEGTPAGDSTPENCQPGKGGSPVQRGASLGPGICRHKEGRASLERGHPVQREGYASLERGHPVQREGCASLERGHPVQREGYASLERGHPVQRDASLE